MPHPKVGMHFEDVRKRVKRIASTKGNKVLQERLVNSLLNQSRLNDGEGAVSELVSEVNHNSTFMSGAGNKQTGIDFCKVCHKVPKHCKCKKGSA